MTNTQEQTPRSLSGRTGRMLLELGVGVHRMGYGQLCLAVPRYAEDLTQCLTKDTYPYVARQLGCTDGRAVEHAIRMAILDAWDRRDPAVWDSYFPCGEKPPSNKQFIATLAAFLQ